MDHPSNPIETTKFHFALMYHSIGHRETGLPPPARTSKPNVVFNLEILKTKLKRVLLLCVDYGML